jgi:hypothetical protein
LQQNPVSLGLKVSVSVSWRYALRKAQTGVAIVVCVVTVAACHETTSPAAVSVARVSVTVPFSESADAGQSVRYQSQVRSEETVSVWIVGCEAGRPDFDLRARGATVDSVRATCAVSRASELLPGMTIVASGTFPRRAGVEYVPIVVVSRTADGRNAVTIRGTAFTVP